MKSVFITGGSTGIGWSMAKVYLDRGYRVGICGRNESKLVPEAKSYSELKFYALDVTDRDKLHAAVRDFHAGGGLDIIVANAGISVGNKSAIPDFERSRRVIDVNVLGLMHTFEVAIELFQKQNGGHLVAISSIAGRQGLPGASAYSASKAAVTVYCESLAIDLAPLNISVTTIGPGFVDTPLTSVNKHPMPFIMPADKAAKLIVRAIDKKRELYYFPWVMNMASWFSYHMPRWFYRFLMRLKLVKVSA